MRMSECERRGLEHALQGVPFPVFLFGSRLDDGRRGGDIDLAVLATRLAPAERLALSLRMAVRFRSICDEKLDVQVFDTESLSVEERAFLAITRREPLALPSSANTSTRTDAGCGADKNCDPFSPTRLLHHGRRRQSLDDHRRQVIAQPGAGCTFDDRAMQEVDELGRREGMMPAHDLTHAFLAKLLAARPIPLW